MDGAGLKITTSISEFDIMSVSVDSATAVTTMPIIDSEGSKVTGFNAVIKLDN